MINSFNSNNIIFYCNCPKVIVESYEFDPDYRITNDERKNKKVVKVPLDKFVEYINNLSSEIKKKQLSNIVYGIKSELIEGKLTVNSDDLPLINSNQICIDAGSLILNFFKAENKNKEKVDGEFFEFLGWILTEDNCFARITASMNLEKTVHKLLMKLEVIKYDSDEIPFNYDFRYLYDEDFNCESILKEPLYILLRNIQKIGKMISYNTRIKEEQDSINTMLDHVSFYVPDNRPKIKLEAETFIIDKYNDISTGKKEKYESIIKNNRFIKSTIFKKIKKLQSLLKGKQSSYYLSSKWDIKNEKISVERRHLEHLLSKKCNSKIYINTDSFIIYKSLIYMKDQNKLKFVLGSNFSSYIHPDHNLHYISAHNVEYNEENFDLFYNFSIVNISSAMTQTKEFRNNFELARFSISTTCKKDILHATFIDDGIYAYTLNEYKYVINNLVNDFNFTTPKENQLIEN